jgi:polar amino acid transport system substrate-binding protein
MLKNYLFYFVAVLFSVKTFAESPLTVVTESLPPMQYLADGELVGGASEIVKAVLRKSGLNIDIQIMPWARAYSMAQENSNTLIYSIHRTPFREDKFHWLGPVGDLHVALLELAPSAGHHINSIEDAKDFLVGVVRHSSPHEYLLRKGFTEDKNLFLFGSREQEKRLFVNRKIDFILSYTAGMDFKLGDLGYQQQQVQVAYVDPELSQKLYLAASLKTDEKLLDKLKKSMQDVMQSSQYQRWYNSTSSLSISSSK